VMQATQQAVKSHNLEQSTKNQKRIDFTAMQSGIESKGSPP